MQRLSALHLIGLLFRVPEWHLHAFVGYCDVRSFPVQVYQGGKRLLSSLIVIAAGFRRPVVLFGAIADVANEKLASEMPDLFIIASECLQPLSCSSVYV